MPVILLSDNGSSRADSTIQLRKLANELGSKTSQTIHPVSLQHADSIDAKLLDGKPAQIFNSFMSQQLSKGEHEFILLPLFFGNSKALTRFIPDEIEKLSREYGPFELKIGDVIYPLPQGEPLLSDIIYDHITNTSDRYKQTFDDIVLVDHGSPVPRVTEVRKHLAQSVQQKLPASYPLEQAVMERREGHEYDFNGDLLEHWLLTKAESGAHSALVVMMFFLPGRHAGENGDIVEICKSVMQKYPEFNIVISPLISENPKFLQILEERLERLL